MAGEILTAGFKIVGDAKGGVKAVRDVRKELDKMSEGAAMAARKTALVTKRLVQFGAAGVAAAAAAGGVIVARNLEIIDSLAKTSDKLGITTEALAGFQLAAELTGASSDTLTRAMRDMGKRVSEAAQGTGEAGLALRELGLDAKELTRLSLDEQFRTLSDAISNAGSKATQLRLADKLMGEGGANLLNTLALGREGLAGISAEAERMGLTISREAAAGVEALNDNFTRIQGFADGFGRQLTAGLVNPFNVLATRLVETQNEFIDFGNTSKTVSEFASNAIVKVLEVLQGVKIGFMALKVAAGNFATGFAYAFEVVPLKAFNALKELISDFVTKSLGAVLRKLQEVAEWFAKFDPSGVAKDAAKSLRGATKALEEFKVEKASEENTLARALAEQTAQAYAELIDEIEKLETIAPQFAADLKKIAAANQKLAETATAAAAAGEDNAESSVKQQDKFTQVRDALIFESEQLKRNSREQFINAQVRKLGADAIPKQIEKIKELAGALFDEKEARKFNKTLAEGFGGAFDALMTGGENVFDKLEDSFKSTLARMANEVLTGPLMKSLEGIFSGDKGIGGLFDGIATTGLKGAIGGFGIGQAVTGLTGGNQKNAAIGAAIGSVIPGVGTLIGSAVGGALGGLFGRDKPKKPKFQLASNIAGGINFKGRELGFEGGIFESGAFGTVGFESGATRKINSDQLREMAGAITAVDDAINQFIGADTQLRIRNALTTFTGTSSKNTTESGFFGAFRERLDIIDDEISGAFGKALKQISETSDSLEEFGQRLDAVKQLGPLLNKLFGLNELGTDTLSESVGGPERLKSLLDSYLENFVDFDVALEKQIGALSQDLGRQLNKLGINSAAEVISQIEKAQSGQAVANLGALLEAAEVYGKMIELEKQLAEARKETAKNTDELNKINASNARELISLNLTGVARDLHRLQLEFDAAAREAIEASDSVGDSFVSLGLLAAVHMKKRENIIREAEQAITAEFEAIAAAINGVREGIAAAIVGVNRSAGGFDEVGHQKGIIQSIIDQFVSTDDINRRIDLVSQGKDAVVARYQAELSALDEVQQKQKSLYESQLAAIKGLKEAADSFLLSDVSPLTSGQRFGAAQSQFSALLSAARGGDVDALGGLGGAAQALLSEGKDRFSTSSQTFADLFAQVQADLRSFGITAAGGLDEVAYKREVKALQEKAVSELQFLQQVLNDLETAASNDNDRRIAELQTMLISNDNARTDRTVAAIDNLSSAISGQQVTTPVTAATAQPYDISSYIADIGPYGYGATQTLPSGQNIIMTALGPVVQEISYMTRRLEDQTDAVNRAISTMSRTGTS